MAIKKKRKAMTTLLLAVAAGLAGLGALYGIPVYREYRIQKAEIARRSQMPYFTEFHLSWDQVADMWLFFGVETTPKRYWDVQEYDNEWPDYSYCVLEPTGRTEKVAVVLTYRMFVNPKYEEVKKAGELASEYGLSEENPMTVDWVLENPAEAVEIIRIANYTRGDYHGICSMVDDVYDEIMGLESETEQE